MTTTPTTTPLTDADLDWLARQDGYAAKARAAAEIRALRARRDDLLAALKAIAAVEGGAADVERMVNDMWSFARAAIARAEGDK